MRLRTSTRPLKKVLASLVVLGAMSYLTVGGTSALLNAQTTNAGSTAASATFTLGDKVNSGTICTSNGTGSSGNVNPTCNAFFTNATLRFPSSTFVTTNVTITNSGSTDASNLVLYAPSCLSAVSPGATFVGGTNLCSSSSPLEMYVQEWTSSTFGTALKCYYPSATGACSTAGGAFGTFIANAYSATHNLALGAGPVAGSSRYFTIGFELPTTADNGSEGEEADFALTWHAQTTS